MNNTIRTSRTLGSNRFTGRIPFAVLARQVFSLDPAIEWVALEEAGSEPRWAWRDQETGRLFAASAADTAQVIDPLLFMVAEGHDNLCNEQPSANPHRLLFVVLAYADVVQIAMRLGPYALLTVAVPPSMDAHFLGTKLISHLDRYSKTRADAAGDSLKPAGDVVFAHP